MSEQRVLGERPTGFTRASRRYKKNRVCREAECGTLLSIYNEGQFCSLHEPMKVPRTRGRKIA